MKIEWIFYLLSCLSVIGALMVILSQNPIRSVLYLVFTFFTISAQYVLLNAQFLALVNVVVYAGAIMVLFLFVIMYLNLNTTVLLIVQMIVSAKMPLMLHLLYLGIKLELFFIA